MTDMSRMLRQAAEDKELLFVAHKAIEDILVEWRNLRLSTPFVANGLVIREYDGESSSTIRMSTREAIVTALNAMAKHLEEK